MARLKNSTIKVYSEDRKESMEVTFTVNVDSKGIFTTTLKPGDVEEIKALGIERVGSKNRLNNEGHFRGKTLDKLLIQIKELLEECISRELIEDKIVIRYAVNASCSFCLTMDGEIIPNGAWDKDGPIDKGKGWMGGNVDSHAGNQKPTMIQLWVKPYKKKTYRYKSGEERSEYERLHQFAHHKHEADDDQYHLQWLESLVGSSPRTGSQFYGTDHTVREMDYTEENARFFVQLFKGMAQVAWMMAKLDYVQFTHKLIQENRQFLLPKKGQWPE